MRRRPLLVVGLLVLAALAGCSAAGELEMDRVDAQGLADAASQPAERSDDDGSRRRVLPRAVENGSATVTGRSPPVDPELAIAHEDAYYDVSWSVVDREEGTSVGVAIDYNATNTSGPAVEYADLPAADRAVLDGLLPPRTDRRVSGPEMGAGGTYTDAEREASVLLEDAPGTVIVIHEGKRYRVTVEDPEPVTLKTYRYTATEVAASAEAYAERIENEYAFELSDANLSDRQQSVIEEAVRNGSYRAESDDDEAFRSVIELFREHEPLTEGASTGTWVVRHEGELYVVDLQYGGFDVG